VVLKCYEIKLDVLINAKSVQKSLVLLNQERECLPHPPRGRCFNRAGWAQVIRPTISGHLTK
ncbi:MAG: hypothetical protein V7677_05350, partial [Motiliproteus sp.]